MEKKNLVKIRGTATIKPDNSFDFVPSQQGEPIQRSVKTHRKSKVYETAGNDKQSMVCHLVVDKNAVDPAAEMYEDFISLTKEMSQKTPPSLKGKTLMDDGEVKVIANKNGKLQVIININYFSEINLTQKLVTIIYRTTQCLVSNETYLNKQRRAQKQTSGDVSQIAE